ncbi:putative permease [Clostridiales Family XIII bacterium PM5-7]
MLSVFISILTIFFMVLIGFVACKKNILPFAANEYFVKLLLSICIPCMIISSMATKVLQEDTLTQVFEMLIGSAAYFIIGALVSYGIVKLIRYNPAEDQGVLMVILTSINSGFMGFPITKSIFGDDALFLMVINHSVLTFYFYSILKIQLKVGEKKSRLSLIEMIKPFINTCMGATVIGFIILFARIQVPDFIVELTATIGNATTPISMFVVGLQLSQSDFRKMLRNKKLIFVCLCNVLLMPALMLLAVHWAPISSLTKLSLVFSVSFPTAVISVALASKEEKNAALLAEGVALTTLFSMVTLPISAMVLMNLYG